MDRDLDGTDENDVVLEADPDPPTVVDLLPTDSGLYYTSLPGGGDPGGLYYFTEDLEEPRVRLMGAPGATAFVGGDGIRLAETVGLGAYTEVVRGKDGALYVADRQRNVIMRIARMVPPMYLSSWVTSADGNEVYLFDEEGRHLETRDARTHALIYTFGYDTDGLLSTVSDAYGRTTTLQRTQGTITGVEGPDGVLTSITVDANGYLDTVTDASAAVIDLEHGPTGLLEAMSDADSLTEYEYDEGGALMEDRHTIAYTPPGGGATTSEVIAKDVVPQLTASPKAGAVQHVSPELRETSYWFERTGTDVAREVTFPDQTQNSSTHTPERDEVTFADGTVVTTFWEADERLGANTRAPAEIRVQTPDGLLRETTFERSFEPRCSIYDEEPECGTQPPGEVPQEWRLDADRIVETVQRGTQTWTTTYDRAHLEAGSPVAAQIVAESPARTTTTTLNDEGRVATVQVGTQAPVSYAYDGQGRVTSISQTDGADTRIVSFGYDANGWLETVTDAENRTTTFQRDAVGRVLQQISPVPSEVIGFTYDDAGNVTSVTPPSRPAHDFHYDSADRLREYAPPPLAGVPNPQTEYTYTPDDQTDDTSLPQGSLVDFQYDVSTGKVTLVTTPEADYGFVYDDGPGNTGTLASVSVAHDDMSIGTLMLTYDYDGDLVTEEAMTGLVAGTVGWGYDDLLRVDEETAAGDTVIYGYDSAGRLTTMGALTATYEPDTAQLASTTLGTVETTHSYSAFGDLSGIDYEAANTSFYEVTYTHDDFGRVQTKTETRPGSTRLRCYEYDASDRLAAVYDAANSGGCTGSQLEAYTYDLNGNRESVTNSAGTITAANIVTDDQDRLLQHGDFTYAYNEDGQMISRTQTSSGDTWLYTYDANGNLREVDPPGVGGTISYVIDPRNRRVGRRVDGTLMQGFLYGDQLNPIAELDGSGTLISRFVYGTSDHVPDYMIRGGITYRFITDHLGSVVGVYDLTNGVEVQTREYDAYGRIVAETGSFSQPFGFAGGLYDEGTGLVRFGARDYRPEVGSWAAKDPLRFGAGDGSLFSYCYGDPANYLDRGGLAPSRPYLDPHEAARAWADRYYYGLGEEFKRREVCAPIFFHDVPFSPVPVRLYYYDSDFNHVGHESGCRPFRRFKDDVPPDFAWGDCHTHGSDDPDFNNEEMSRQDKTTCVGRRTGTGRCWTFTPKQKCICFEHGGVSSCPQ